MDDIKAGGKFSECHFIEFYGLSGRMHRRRWSADSNNTGIRQLRAKAIYDEDKSLPVRKSHENRHVVEIYNEFLQMVLVDISLINFFILIMSNVVSILHK